MSFVDLLHGIETTGVKIAENWVLLWVYWLCDVTIIICDGSVIKENDHNAQNKTKTKELNTEKRWSNTGYDNHNLCRLQVATSNT